MQRGGCPFTEAALLLHEGCLPVGNGAAAVGVRVPDRSVLVLCRHMPRSGVTGSCGNSVFSFLK